MEEQLGPAAYLTIGDNLSTSLETLSKKEKEETSLETLAKANYGALTTIDKQADIVQTVEIVEADRLFERAVPKLHALDTPAPNLDSSRFWELLTALTTNGAKVSEGIPGIRELWRDTERYAGITSRSQYNVDPRLVREDVKYRLLTQLSELTPIEVAYILNGSIAHEFLGKDARKFATRQTFMRRVIYNSARTVMRQARKWMALDHLDRDAKDKRSNEEINAQVFGKGSIFNPRPFAAHKPLGKVDVPVGDFIDGSNEMVSRLVQGLAIYWLRVAYSAAAPNYDPDDLKMLLTRASEHYKHELNMLTNADSVTYPEGGPKKTPPAVSDGNEAHFEVRWMLQSRARFVNRTMIPYLGVEGYTRAITNYDRDVMIQLKRQAIKAMAHCYAGLVYVPVKQNAGTVVWFDDTLKKWHELNRGLLKNNQWGMEFSEVPETAKHVVQKAISSAVSRPREMLADTPATKAQPPMTPKEMKELDTVEFGTSLRDLAATLKETFDDPEKAINLITLAQSKKAAQKKG